MDNARNCHRKDKSAKGIQGAVPNLQTSRHAGSPKDSHRSLHQISKVREREGVSLRSIARRWKVNIARLRQLEDEHTDLTLSQLYQWQHVLEVPVSELLIDIDHPLSTPVLRRAQMIRLMKTAATIAGKARHARISHLAHRLMQQLIEIMPELDGIKAWQDDADKFGPGHATSASDLAAEEEINAHKQ
ncbi:MAG: hypothetical protein GTO62_01135 [Planctomycetales bacterium]|nr:hypothetical protein [Planctomycetales bacterium]NIP67818.1 hypothetical protein [Planctomycetales bacterium]